jgi:hypothetical protein
MIMKTILAALLATTLFSLSTYADDGPTFVKVGSTYVLTANSGVTLPHLVTIAATGGGGWYRVTTPSDNDPNGHSSAGLGDRWINFNQLVEVREAIAKKGPK